MTIFRMMVGRSLSNNEVLLLDEIAECLQNDNFEVNLGGSFFDYSESIRCIRQNRIFDRNGIEIRQKEERWEYTDHGSSLLSNMEQFGYRRVKYEDMLDFLTNSILKGFI